MKKGGAEQSFIGASGDGDSHISFVTQRLQSFRQQVQISRADVYCLRKTLN